MGSQREAAERHVWYLRDRVAELLPWTDPVVMETSGFPVMRLQLLPAVSLLASNATGCWRLEVRPDFQRANTPRGRRFQLAMRSDRDVGAVADQVLYTCMEEWKETAVATDVSAAMQAKAAEQLEAVANHRPPSVVRRPARTDGITTDWPSSL